MTSFDDLDDTDRSMIRIDRKGEMTIENIANKRKLAVETVKKVLDIYVNKGKLAAKELKGMKKSDDEEETEAFEEKHMEVAFWFFQHHKYVVKEGATYTKYDRALKKCIVFYDCFGRLLDGETANGKITETTEWKEIPGLYAAKWKTYEHEGETSCESKVDNGAGGAFVTEEEEETMMDVVGQIFSKKDMTLLGCCTFVKIGEYTGILTGIDVVSDKNQWRDCIAKFETEEGKLEIIYSSDDTVISDKKLATSFLICTIVDRMNFNGYDKMVTEKSKALKVGSTVAGYYFAGDDKMSTQRTIEQVTPSTQFIGEKLKNSSGCPIYLSNLLIGIYSGTESDENLNNVTSIQDISKWISEAGIEVVLLVGQTVKAFWTDGFEYNAKIERITEMGYYVNFYQFDDTKLEVAKDSVRRHPDKAAPEVEFDEVEFEKLSAWLKKVGLSKYATNFKEHGIRSIEVLAAMGKEEQRAKLEEMRFRSGSILKMETHIRNFVTYGEKKPTQNAKIHEINNKQMGAGFEAPNNDFTEYYKAKHPQNKCSIGWTTQRILKEMDLPESIQKGVACTFYLKSTGQGRYYEIDIKWKIDP